MGLEEAIADMQTVESAAVFWWPENKALAKTPLLLTQRQEDAVQRMYDLIQKDETLIGQAVNRKSGETYLPVLQVWKNHAERYLQQGTFEEKEIHAFYRAHQQLRSFYLHRAREQLPEGKKIISEPRLNRFLHGISYELASELNRNCVLESGPRRNTVYR